MKADITRKTFHEEKHYDRVTMQQGRVQLDADWNEQADIRIYRSTTTASDVIGKNGAPTDNPGFEIKASKNYGTKSFGRQYTVGKGRYYVDGILCENENDVDATKQPDLPLLLLCSWDDLSSSDSDTRNHAISRILDFLRAFIPSYNGKSWSDLKAVSVETKNNDKEKIIRPSEDPDDFFSVTLDNDHPAEATKAIVRFGEKHEEILELVIVKDVYDDDKIKIGFSPAIPFSNRKYIVYLDVWEREITWLDDPHLREVALGGVDTATRTKIVWQVKLLPVRVDSNYESEDKYNKEIQQQLQQEEQKYQTEELKERGEGSSSSSSSSKPGYCHCESQYPEWEQLISEPKCALQARLKPAYPARDQCELPTEAAFHGPLHQLYRVEIHEGGTLNNGATFKWSRDNGIVASKIANIAGTENKISVENIGRDNSRFGYPIGSWIEITDDRHELWGIPGTLAEVADVKGNVIFFKPDTVKGESITNENYPKMHNPKVRRWDSIGTIKQGVSAENEGFIDVEHDIQIKFGEFAGYSNGHSPFFPPGAYWLIPARSMDTWKGIEWPIDENGKPAALLPEGIKHHFSKLALLSIACLEKGNDYDDVREIEEQPKSIEQQQQQQQEQEEQKYQREGKTGRVHKCIAKIDDCRRFFLPLNSLILRYVSGDGQEGWADNILPTELTARVTSGDVPVKGIMVKFTIEKGGGSLQKDGATIKDHEYCVVSNDAGFVSCGWVLGNEGNQQVKAIVVDIECRDVLVDLPVYFNANLSEVSYNVTRTGVVTLDLTKEGRPEDGIYQKIKHHATIKPGKYGLSPPPYVGLGLVSLIVDETSNLEAESATDGTGSADATVQFIHEGSLPDLSIKRIRLRAVNIGPETFDVSLDKGVIGKLSETYHYIRLRWWAIACQEEAPQFVSRI